MASIPAARREDPSPIPSDLVRQQDFDRHATLGTPDVDKRAVPFPGKLPAMIFASETEAGHGLEKAFQALQIGIQGAEEVRPVLTSFWGLPVRRPSVSEPQNG